MATHLFKEQEQVNCELRPSWAKQWDHISKGKEKTRGRLIFPRRKCPDAAEMPRKEAKKGLNSAEAENSGQMDSRDI